MLLHYPVKHLMSAKQAINDKLQGSVATYLSCGGVVNKQIKKSLLLSLWVNFLKIGVEFCISFPNYMVHTYSLQAIA